MTVVIGLMSGTSVDGVDAALVNITGTDWDLDVELVAGITYPYPQALRKQILAVASGAAISLAELAQLDEAIAQVFAEAAQQIQFSQVRAELIGSHGQTVYHRRANSSALGYSLQLGRGAVIAQHTKICTVSNFRLADLAAGGQGAPLVPKVDAYLFGHPDVSRCIQNIGGIGNLTYLPPMKDNPSWEQEIRGWDTGPGNILLDLAIQHFTNGAQLYDQDGKTAASGIPCYQLVEQWLQQDYFQQLPPKSTGRELFGLSYLHQCLRQAEPYHLSPADVLATLTELTVASIAHNYQNFLPQLPQQVLLCGGGSRNLYLKQRLEAKLPSVGVMTTDEVGVSADFKEAIAFAVLAYWRMQGIFGNLPQVTGASAAVCLGDVHPVYGLVELNC